MDTQNTDPHVHSKYLKIPVNPPYIKPPEPVLNNLGLPKKKYYTTQDLCKVLNIRPDTLRYRFRKGYYKEVKKIRGKRRFTESELKDIINISKNEKRIVFYEIQK